MRPWCQWYVLQVTAKDANAKAREYADEHLIQCIISATCRPVHREESAITAPIFDDHRVGSDEEKSDSTVAAVSRSGASMNAPRVTSGTFALVKNLNF